MNKEMSFYKIKIKKSNKFKMFSLKNIFLRMKKIKIRLYNNIKVESVNIN